MVILNDVQNNIPRKKPIEIELLVLLCFAYHSVLKIEVKCALKNIRPYLHCMVLQPRTIYPPNNFQQFKTFWAVTALREHCDTNFALR
jgi:hypothetical protein